ncbi:Glycosyltransferase Family 1 protein [Gigaspora rosea]|uniref:Glycosyltransferase Family 1 protein n=1 Tax=Gigaspora rosea TaxID=44941 RepID=A0A397W390_9GLOM|nr:Glycosyltransferase Family 1 protein [Gigaspora rosea]
MSPKYSLLAFWHIAMLIFFSINVTFGSEHLSEFIQLSSSLDRGNMPKNIIAASFAGGTNHLVPLLEICKILKDRGYNVTLIAPGNFTAKSVSYSSIPQITVDVLDMGEVYSTFEEDLIKMDHMKTYSAITSYASSVYVKFYNIYKQIAEEVNVDLFFCDYMMNFACFDIAWKLGKPVVGIASMLGYITNLPPYRSDPLMGCHVTMENESFYNRFICIIKPLKFLLNSAPLGEVNSQREKVGVDPSWDFRGRISNILILTDNFYGFEIPMALPPLHQEIGPILPDTFPNLTPTLNSFLETHPRTIYFALGSIMQTTPKNIITILKSFVELIDQNVIDGVIWASVKTNTSRLLSTDDDINISTILNNDHPHIHIVKYAPQFAILSHENTKLFLSHGGASSCHESIYTATPMLVLPMFGDQLGNAEKLEVFGMALRLTPINLEITDVVSKIKKLLNEGSFKKNAERLQFLAKINSKRKYRGADMIEVVMNAAKFEGIEDENGKLRIDNNVLLKEWITPDSRMGFIRGSYLDVYCTIIIILLSLFGGILFSTWKIAKFFFNISRDSSKPKTE